jgi:hypothetical protein
MQLRVRLPFLSTQCGSRSGGAKEGLCWVLSGGDYPDRQFFLALKGPTFAEVLVQLLKEIGSVSILTSLYEWVVACDFSIRWGLCRISDLKV